jgi:hypothetical protein
MTLLELSAFDSERAFCGLTSIEGFAATFSILFFSEKAATDSFKEEGEALERVFTTSRFFSLFWFAPINESPKRRKKVNGYDKPGYFSHEGDRFFLLGRRLKNQV